MKMKLTGIFIAGCLLGQLIGEISTVVGQRKVWEYQAIKHNAAHYDQTTGEFKWNQ